MVFFSLYRTCCRIRCISWILVFCQSRLSRLSRLSAPPSAGLRGFPFPGRSSYQLPASDYDVLFLHLERREDGASASTTLVREETSTKVCLATRRCFPADQRYGFADHLKFSIMSNASTATFSSPSEWFKSFPIAANGTRQSPIDIRTTSCTCNDKSQPLVMRYPETITGAILKNSGYGWVVNVGHEDALLTSLTGGPLEEKYILEQFHAHWGSDCDCGSEHTVDGVSYAAEVSPRLQHN